MHTSCNLCILLCSKYVQRVLMGQTLVGLFYQDLLGASWNYVALEVVKEKCECFCVWAQGLHVYTSRYERYVFVESIDSGAGTLCCCKLASWQPRHLWHRGRL